MSRSGRLRLRAAIAAAALACTAAAAAAPPAAGRYAGELCVTLPTQDRNCGPADAEVFRSQQLLVRIADIVYRLTLHSSQLDVVLMHGAVQIDGFVAPYEWLADGVLQFDDPDKRMRYALTLGERR